jgi:DNA-binding SARP family transcriptional activator/tetratricopeptide (TPR) repeat protein
MDGQLFLRTLGVPALFAPNGDPIRFRVKKHVALLVYLAVEQRNAHRRDHLVNLLWPRASAADGRHSLSTALSVLRAKLGRAAVETTRDTIRLAAGVVAVDLTRLEAGEVLADETRPELEVAAFLDGFDLADADEFLRWSEREQARLLPAILRAMIVLIDRCRRTADSRSMERLADRMMALDPLSEDAIRAKMESRAFDGDRLTALRVFEEWKEMLGRELGAVPSERVDGIAVRLRRRGWERSANDRIPSVRTDQWRGRPFIGRQAEYRVLYEGWERTQRGEPGHALVRGDSGVGKTTLVERLSTAAGLEGASVSRVQCYELEQEIPYSVVSGLVVGLLDRPGVTATSPEALAELGRIVPQIRERFSNLPIPVESQGETVRVRLADAFHEMILALTGEHPVILVVDDLHLADDASLAVLHVVMRRAKTQPLMVVLTVRPAELGQSPQAARLLESLIALGFQEMSLPPMADVDARAFLDSLFAPSDSKPTSALKRALLKAAGGFPMVLELLVQDWLAHGEHSLALSLGAMTADLEVNVATTPPYDQLLQRTLRSLDSADQRVLSVAAILGPRLNDLDWYELADIGLGEAMGGLAKLLALRVLRESGNGLEFVNELVRASAYRAVPSPVRRTLHSRIAERLLALPKEEHQALGLEIAWHCFRAGRSDDALTHLLAGAEEAIRRGAPYEAELALGRDSIRKEARIAPDRVTLLVRALQEQARWTESIAELEAGQQAGTLIDHDEIFVLREWARDFTENQSDAYLASTFQQLGEIIAHSRHSAIRLRAARLVASICGRELATTAAARMRPIVFGLPLDHLDQHGRAAIHLARAQLCYTTADTQGTKRELESLSLFMPPDQADSLAASRQVLLACLAVWEGAYEDALRHNTIALELSTRRGIGPTGPVHLANIAQCHGRLGNLSEQIATAEKARDGLGPRFQQFTEIQIPYWLGAGYARRGENARVIEVCRQAEDRFAFGSEAWKRIWTVYKADLLALIGRPDEAINAVCTLDYRDRYPVHFDGIFLRWHARAASSTLELDEVRSRLESAVTKLELYPMLDRAEILMTRQYLRDANNEAMGSDIQSLACVLRSLPPAVTDYFRQLEFLHA